MSEDLIAAIWIAGVPITGVILAMVMNLRTNDVSEDSWVLLAVICFAWPAWIFLGVFIVVCWLIFSPMLLVMHLNSQRKRKNEELAGKPKSTPEYDPYRRESE